MIIALLVSSSVLVIGIFCLRKLTLGRISMRLRYALWLLVAARLLFPLPVGTSPFSVLNLLPGTVWGRTQGFLSEKEDSQAVLADEIQRLPLAGKQEEAFFGEWNDDAGVLPAAIQNPAGGEEVSRQAVTASVEENPSGYTVAGDREVRGQDAFLDFRFLVGLWLPGFLATGGYMLFSWVRLTRYLNRNRRELPAGTVPGEFAKRFSQNGITVYQVRGLPGPCLAGRHIYIGEQEIQDQELLHILAHEYCHFLHGDGFWAFLRCMLAAVYWFHPLVWAAVCAARQDSELACDEKAVELLGESQRFAYGRTLLGLLKEKDGGSKKCPGTPFMMDGGERNVRKRILALTKKVQTKRTVLAAVLGAVVLVCGCAFTGADQESGAVGTDRSADAERTQAAPDERKQRLSEEDSGEAASVRKEYEAAAETEKRLEDQIRKLEEEALQETDQAAFEDVLYDYDDSGLSRNREVDYQTYLRYTLGEAENPMEDGWYLVCRNEEAGISLYGLYTGKFGFRGLKTLIGEDVNTYDMQWCPSYLNSTSDNIRVLEQAQDGLPRRFVWKLPAAESSTEEIWRLYSGYRYDTGTVDVKVLYEEECLSWAKKYLHFDVDQEAAKIYVTYDGDMYLGDIDISAYQDWETEDVQIVPDTVAFTLDYGAWEGTADTGVEGLAVHLSPGLKFRGAEGLWFDGLSVLTVQVVEDESSDSGFRLQKPEIDGHYVVNAPWQERELKEIGGGTQGAEAGVG